MTAHTTTDTSNGQPWDWRASQDWTGRKALVVGAGESGQACARWLVRRGMRVRLIDSRAIQVDWQSPMLEVQLEAPKPMGVDQLDGVDLVVTSPGLSPHPDRLGSISELIAACRRRGLAIVQELDLFNWGLYCLGTGRGDLKDGGQLEIDRPQILAITGTNGKTTTAMLTAYLLTQAGLDVQLAGNVSPSLLAALMDREDRGLMPQAWVLELSSFQLAQVEAFQPTASVVLNLEEDHLDWHADLEDYRQSKLRILGMPRATGVVMLDRDQEDLAQRLQERLRSHQEMVVGYGLGPIAPNALGLGVIHEGLDWIVRRASLDEDEPSRLMPVGALRIPGPHNLRNAMAALGLALTVTKDLASLLHGLRSYRGEPHRLEEIASMGPVRFIDDSKGTNVDATLAALSAFEEPVVVILGGDGKGQRFERLVNRVQERRIQAICIGRDGPTIAQMLEAKGCHCHRADSLEAAVENGWTLALNAAQESGRAVLLLSPACASFDMFTGYAHRARVFSEAVAALAAREGQPC